MQPTIFLSHSSLDLPVVRLVRNYLEELETNPLLFNLVSLKEPERFWPLIQSEIAARQFFIYCESANAAASPWVQREREEVSKISKKRLLELPVSEAEAIDFEKLSQFIDSTKVFFSYAHADIERVTPIRQRIESEGFEVFDPSHHAFDGRHWSDVMRDGLESASIVIVFLSKQSLQSEWVLDEADFALRRHKLILTAIEPMRGLSGLIPLRFNRHYIGDLTRDGEVEHLIDFLFSESQTPPETR